MARRKLVVIGMLGTMLDQASGADALGAVAAHGVALPARGSAGGPAGAASRPAVSRGWRARRRRHRAGVTGDGGATSNGWRSRPLGPGGDVRRAARLRAALPLPSRAGGLPRPHHHRHAHRADLHVPAGGVPAHPRRGWSRRRRRHGPRQGRRPGTYTHHRPRPVEVRHARRALPAGAARGPVLPQGRHRHAQRRLQPAHRAD